MLTVLVATADSFAAHYEVSRETLARLTTLHDLTLRWNKRINLIGRDTERVLWSRHIADSAQLWTLRPASTLHWADLGAGAGFPGLVIAALAAQDAPDLHITLVESSARKAAFLAEASREMGLKIRILHDRIEAIDPLGADVVSARALAPLDRLLAHTQNHRAPHGIGLFPKGETVHKEVEAAAARWRFERRLHRSVTEPGAAIVEVGAVARV